VAGLLLPSRQLATQASRWVPAQEVADGGQALQAQKEPITYNGGGGVDDEHVPVQALVIVPLQEPQVQEQGAPAA
jgi:hypothetical protein